VIRKHLIFHSCTWFVLEIAEGIRTTRHFVCTIIHHVSFYHYTFNYAQSLSSWYDLINNSIKCFTSFLLLNFQMRKIIQWRRIQGQKVINFGKKFCNLQKKKKKKKKKIFFFFQKYFGGTNEVNKNHGIIECY
jgi:hypothetical protein